NTVRLLADALALAEPEQQRWVAAVQGANPRQAEAGPPGTGGPARPPRRVVIAVLTRDAQDRPGPAVTWLIRGPGPTPPGEHHARTMPAIPASRRQAK